MSENGISRLWSVASATAVAMALAGCGGGGGGAAPATSLVPGTSATATPLPAAGSVGAGALSFTMLIPTKSGSSSSRAPAFTSPSTASVAITLAGQKTPLATANLSASSPGCSATSAGTSCTISTSAPAGNDTFVITTYDAANASGHLLSTAQVPATITASATTRVPLTLNGVVNAVTVLLGSSTVPVGNPASVSVTIVAYDSGGNAIVGSGNFSPAITLVDSDTSGVTTLSASSVTVPGTTVSLSYTGNSLSSATITPSVAGAGGAMTAATFTPSGTTLLNYLIPSSIANVIGDMTSTTLGKDGNIWFSAQGGSYVGYITTAGTVTYYPNALQATWAYQAATASDGGMWFGDYSGVLTRVDTSGNVTAATSYKTPCQNTTSLCGGFEYPPGEMVLAQDGNIWFSDPNYGYIGNITPGGAVTEFDPTLLPGWPGGSTYPYQMSAGAADPNAVYFADDNAGYIVRVAIANGVPTGVTSVLAPCSVDAVTVGSDGNVWFGDNCANVGMVPVANFTQSAVLSWSFSSVTNYFANVLFTNGHLWLTNDDDPYTYHLTGLTGLSVTQAPSITAIQTGQSYASAMTVGSDNNVWTVSDDNQSTVDKIIYGASGSLAALNAKRGSAAVHRGSASSQRFSKHGHHMPSSVKRRTR